MELADFLRQTHADVQTAIDERLSASGQAYPYPESVFAEIVMQHMSEIGMTFEPQVCHFSAKIGNALVRLSGFAISEDAEQIDLFVSLYDGGELLKAIPDSETKAAAEQCIRFLAKCAEGQIAESIDQSNDAYSLAVTIHSCYASLEDVRIFVLTDRQAKAKNFKSRVIADKTVRLEVVDIERLHRHWSEGKPRDELVVNFLEVAGDALPCVYVPGDAADYDCALTVIPGEVLRILYEKYGARLLEANVRSFLSTTVRVNKGLRTTLRENPERFMAYNNGIVVVADEAKIGRLADGSPGLLWLKGMQIVNGGQTTASIYFSKKKDPGIDLSRVRVPAKIIILRSQDPMAEETLISDVSRYANTQNSVKQSDLSANKPYHIELEKLAQTTYCPDGVGRWFYERAAGSYNTMLAREGTTPARLRQLKQVVVPPSRKITKTDLAKYWNAWQQKPHIVSLGSQKNFEQFMAALTEPENQASRPLPGPTDFKEIIAMAIIFKKTQSLVRPMFPAFQANVAAYVVALVANRTGSQVDLHKVWAQQDISAGLRQQIQIWAAEANQCLHTSSDGRMISEWAKKPECWETVKAASYSPISGVIPELSGHHLTQLT